MPADDLPAPLTTRNLLPRSRATSLSLSAAASRSHSPTPSFSRHQLQDTMDPSDAWGTSYNSFITDWSGISLDPSEAWATDTPFVTGSSTMNHHTGSSYTIENSDPFPRRTGKKQLFADNPMHAGPSQPGPSSQPFYHQAQPSEPTSVYGMSALKRKRDESLEPIQPWLHHQNPHPMSIPVVDDPSPGPSYISQDRKGKGKEIDYKGKGKQREATPDNSPILISDSPIINNIKPLATTHVPSKPPSEPLSSYTCPICFSAPTNATLTPCGHICCGECLFTAVKTVMHRAQQAGAPDAQEARCPVCRALIPDWDGKGAGVIGLKTRAIFSL